MRAVLVEDVVDVDQDGARVGNLGLGIARVARQRADQLEEVEQQRLGQALELKGAVVVLGIFGAGGGCCWEVLDALLFESREFVVKLEMRSTELEETTLT